MLCSDSDVGLYSLAASLSEKLWLVSGSLGLVLLPLLSSIKNVSMKSIKTAAVIRVISIFLLPLSIFVSLSAKFLFTTVYGNEYFGSVTPFIILTFAALTYAVRNILGEFFVSSGKMRINSISRAWALLINIVLNIIFIPLWGIKGAAISSFLAYTADTIIGTVYFLKLTDLRLSSLIPSATDIKYIKSKIFDHIKD